MWALLLSPWLWLLLVVVWFAWPFVVNGRRLRLQPRGRLHFTVGELLQSLLWNVVPDTPTSRRAAETRIEDFWGPNTFVSLSIRTSFDLFLTALNLPRGSEIIFSSVTIKDMIVIAKHHGLVPVPLDLDTATMSPRSELLQRAFSPKTRVLVVAHIFGARLDMTPWVKMAREKGVIMVDDCAEVFEGYPVYSGHPDADLSLFSFGSIKTCSALGGSIGRVRDSAVLARMRELHRAYPVRGRLNFAKRIATYVVLRIIQEPLLCGVAARVVEMCGGDFDQVITNSVRGFAGAALIVGIRHQPPLGMLRLLDHKVRTFDSSYIAKRVELARALAEVLSPAVELPGVDCKTHNFWLFPIIVANPASLVAILRHHGFDATQGASQLNYTPVPAELSGSDSEADRARVTALDPCNTRRLWLNLLYLPVYPSMALSEVLRMGQLVKRHAVRVTDDGLCATRERVLGELAERQFDVLVVGGGINGAAVARDAAMRGLKVALVERDDYASCASGNSAKLIHGGFRYVERFMVQLVNELCTERDSLHRLNPNLVGRAAFLLPQYKNYGNKMNKIDVGLWIYDACAMLGSPLHKRQTVEQALADEPLLKEKEMLGSFKYYDCWTNDARLTLANVKSAAANGAVVLNHCAFLEPSFAANKVSGARVRDELTGKAVNVSARHIVHATGAEVDLLSWGNNAGGPVIAATKGTHIAVPLSRLPLKHCVGYQSPADKRWCFCVPFFDIVIIGTTDTPFDVQTQKTSKVNATRAEVEYLLEATNCAFPRVAMTGADVHCTWAALRPLLSEGSGGAPPGDFWSKFRRAFYALAGGSSAGSAQSREDKVFRDGRGITVIAGGKLTPYRVVSERVVDAVVAALGATVALQRSLTRVVPLDSRLSYVEAGTHAWWAYGSLALWLEQRVVTHPSEDTLIDAALPHRMCEVSLAVLVEQAVMLEDVLVRRLGIFFRARDQGRACMGAVAAHMARLLERDNSWVVAQISAYTRVVDASQEWVRQPSSPLQNAVL